MQGKERDAQMETLFSPFRLKGLELKNRIFVPPLVCYTWSDDTGRVSEKNIAHYRAIAQGGLFPAVPFSGAAFLAVPIPQGGLRPAVQTAIRLVFASFSRPAVAP